MKHYRLNQIAMAVLGALLLIFGTRTLIQIMFEEHEAEKPGMEVAGTKHGEEPGAEKPAGAASNLAALLAKGDVAKGMDACREAIRRDETHPAALHNMALAHLEQGQWRRAWWWLRRALQADPEDGSLRRMRLILRTRLAIDSVRGAGARFRRALRRKKPPAAQAGG